jgi:DNA segregation ATPase FtsK/SpoIIIE, S-DNA-T family
MGARGRVRSDMHLEELPWQRRLARDMMLGLGGLLCAIALVAAISFNAADPSWNVAATGSQPSNWMGGPGANLADLLTQLVGLVAVPALLTCFAFCVRLLLKGPGSMQRAALRGWAATGALACLCVLLSAFPVPDSWPMGSGIGGLVGDGLLWLLSWPLSAVPGGNVIVGAFALAGCVWLAFVALSLARNDIEAAIDQALYGWSGFRVWLDGLGDTLAGRSRRKGARGRRVEARTRGRPADREALENGAGDLSAPTGPRIHMAEPEPVDDSLASLQIELPKAQRESQRARRELQPELPILSPQARFELPRLDLLSRPKLRTMNHDEAALKQNARLLMGVLNDFGVRGEIVHVRPGPVVTLYELEPAAGVKSSRVISLADDIARSMSAIACRVAVVPGRNAIGIELPNARRETVFLRSLLSSPDYESSRNELPLALGESIGGEPQVTNLAKMPHLLIAGTTGSGKSVGINAMILSLLYKLTPEQCRFIMIDPKMLELSVYDGIPHLLAPVVTDPKKAVSALKWTVREMESRYQRMSMVGVRNIAGYNEKAREMIARGETFQRTTQTGWDRETGRPVYDTQTLEMEPLPFIVVVIDEMADLMLVAGKDIEGAVQRLAQMARAAGIHLIMATQRPSVDVITGTIKANFPTRISYAVTSKIDSRTILGEMGAEQLLGQGDLLYMASGGRITRMHGPFVSDQEVEEVVKVLKAQGGPDYFEDITAGSDEDGEDDGSPIMDGRFGATGGSGDDLYDRAVAVVLRDGKASTSYIQRALQLGYNRAANLIERMERDGIISPPNHSGKRDILMGRENA